MAALASPTPLVFHAVAGDPQRPLQRLSQQAAAPRSHQTRISPQSLTFRRSYTHVPPTDSSDDEDLAPIKLSAEAQAILGEDNAVGDEEHNEAGHRNKRASIGSRALGSRNREWNDGQSPSTREAGSPPQRIVRIDGKRPSPKTTLARDGSFMYKIHEKSMATVANERESKTPAPEMRRIRVSGSRSQTRTSPSSLPSSRSAESNEKNNKAYLSPDEGLRRGAVAEDQAPAGPSTVMRSRRGEEPGVHSTMRVRRIGAGTLLNGPIRRGMIRRQSDEEGEMAYKREELESPEVEQGRRAHDADLPDRPDELHHSYSDLVRSVERSLRHEESSIPQRAPSSADMLLDRHSPLQLHTSTRANNVSNPTAPALIDHGPPPKSSSSSCKPAFRIPALSALESVNDQENEPPPTFKRTKPSAPLLEIHEDPDQKQNDDKRASPPLHASIQEPRQSHANPQLSPVRQPLAARSNNTPHRPAPAPPPKMSLIEAATSNAGKTRSKKSPHYIINNRTYRRLDCIGRGGSSRVFRIMAENYKIFALKRVNLEEADMAAIAGYKGEIDLLNKLSSNDRVIRLFDYEVNEEKGVLSVMMELGETDFNKMLNEQLKTENAKLDITFTRHYWKEMLECVQAVHAHDIVHSDLKPANFLLVKGQLKLIDFGIASAIQDNTVNVHRENQIGTPNYMSPESLVSHTPATGSVTGQKILKLGKPSDVWSLGCILYQMTYGQPPFAHIQKQFERIMSIPNPKVEIQFPTNGIGGAVVPFGLIKTLRRCLQRDQSLRPTIKELLSDADPFLNPVAISPDMLGRVIGNVMGYCRKREEALRKEGQLGLDGVSCLPRDKDMQGWPGAFYDKLRQAQEEGSAW